MGVLPLQFKDGFTRDSLELDGTEKLDLRGQSEAIKPGQDLTLVIHRADGSRDELAVTCRLDTANEVQYYLNGGILNYVLQNLMAE